LQVRLSTQIVSISARPFAINSIEAFDALVDNGVAVELKTSGNSGSKVPPGSRVTLSCSGLIWDGANTIAQEYSTGTVSFTIGKNHVTPGLEEGVLQLGENDEADIISAPLLAFGDAGQPPYIPPNVHLVYSVKVLSVSTDSAELDKAPEGDASILWSGIAPRATQDAANSAVGTKAKAVVLVMDGAVTKSRETALTDEQLAKAAQGMGMGK